MATQSQSAEAASHYVSPHVSEHRGSDAYGLYAQPIAGPALVYWSRYPKLVRKVVTNTSIYRTYTAYIRY